MSAYISKSLLAQAMTITFSTVEKHAPTIAKDVKDGLEKLLSLPGNEDVNVDDFVRTAFEVGWTAENSDAQCVDNSLGVAILALYGHSYGEAWDRA